MLAQVPSLVMAAPKKPLDGGKSTASTGGDDAQDDALVGEGTLAKFIRDTMRAKGLREKDLADHFDMNQSSAHRWLTGENKPSGPKLAALAEFLGVELEDVYVLKHRQEMPASLTRVENRVADLEKGLALVRDELTEVVDQLRVLLRAVANSEQAARSSRKR